VVPRPSAWAAMGRAFGPWGFEGVAFLSRPALCSDLRCYGAAFRALGLVGFLVIGLVWIACSARFWGVRDECFGFIVSGSGFGGSAAADQCEAGGGI
jgi:hypothetical protein